MAVVTELVVRFTPSIVEEVSAVEPHLVEHRLELALAPRTLHCCHLRYPLGACGPKAAYAPATRGE